MWQTKCAAAIPIKLGLGLNFWPCSEGSSSLGIRSPCFSLISFYCKVLTLCTQIRHTFIQVRISYQLNDFKICMNKVTRVSVLSPTLKLVKVQHYIFILTRLYDLWVVPEKITSLTEDKIYSFISKLSRGTAAVHSDSLVTILLFIGVNLYRSSKKAVHHVI